MHQPGLNESLSNGSPPEHSLMETACFPLQLILGFSPQGLLCAGLAQLKPTAARAVRYKVLVNVPLGVRNVPRSGSLVWRPPGDLNRMVH